MLKVRKQFMLTAAYVVALCHLQLRWKLPTMVQAVEKMIRDACAAEDIAIGDKE